MTSEVVCVHEPALLVIIGVCILSGFLVGVFFAVYLRHARKE